MVHVTMSDEDAGMLREVVEARLLELGREISHTDSRQFRERLFRLEEALQRVVRELPQGLATGG